MSLLIPTGGASRGPEVHRATILDTPTAPTDLVRVVIPTFGTEYWGPTKWEPRVDSEGRVLYPVAGDEALVALDSNRQPLGIVAWGDGAATGTGVGWSDLDTAIGDISGLDGRLDTAEGDISGLDGRLDTAEGGISGLDGRLDTVETDLGTAQGDITALDGRLDLAEPAIVANTADAMRGRITPICPLPYLPVGDQRAHNYTSASTRSATAGAITPGAAGTAMMWVKLDANTVTRALFTHASRFEVTIDSGGQITFTRFFSSGSTYGFWYTTAAVAADWVNDGKWHYIAVAHDGSSTANNPRIYIGSETEPPVEVAVTRSTAPSGSVYTASATLYIGGSASSTSYCRAYMGPVQYANIDVGERQIEAHWRCAQHIVPGVLCSYTMRATNNEYSIYEAQVGTRLDHGTTQPALVDGPDCLERYEGMEVDTCNQAGVGPIWRATFHQYLNSGAGAWSAQGPPLLSNAAAANNTVVSSGYGATAVTGSPTVVPPVDGVYRIEVVLPIQLQTDLTLVDLFIGAWYNGVTLTGWHEYFVATARYQAKTAGGISPYYATLYTTWTLSIVLASGTTATWAHTGSVGKAIGLHPVELRPT